MTTIRSIHETLNGQLSDDGWPMSYGDPVAELAAVRRSAGIAERVDRHRYTIDGPDARDFLQRMITNDMNAVDETRGVYALALSPKASILADFVVTQSGENRFLVDVPVACSEAAYRFFIGHHFSEKLTIQRDESRAQIGVYGPAAPHIFKALFDGELPDSNRATRFVSSGAGDVFIVTMFDLDEPGFEMIGEPDTITGMWEAASASGVEPVGMAALGALYLEAGTPRYGSDFDDNILAVEAGLYGAVSFTKGCYIGQEVVARMKVYGRATRNLRRLLISGNTPLEAGTRLVDNDGDAGFITSSILSPTLEKPIAFGYVSERHVSHGETISVKGSGIKVKVVDAFLAGSLSRA